MAAVVERVLAGLDEDLLEYVAGLCEDTDDDVEKGLAAPRPFAEEEDEQYCDGCHAPVSDPAACKACKKKLCYACAKTTAEEYEEASPWYCPECNH